MTEEELEHIRRTVVSYLKTQEFVTNRILRSIANVSYDEAIAFFGEMVKRGILKRVGARSTTRYTLASQTKTK